MTAGVDSFRTMPVGLEGALEGAIVQRVDLASRAAALHLRVPGESFVLVVVNGRGLGAASGASGVALLERATRTSWPSARLPLPAVADQARARTLLVGGRLAGIERERVLVQREGKLWALVLEGAGEHARVRVRPAEPAAEAPWPAPEELARRGEQVGPWLATSATVVRRAALARAIDQGLGRLRKRAQAVEGDLGRIGDADALAAQASWLVAEAARAPRGASKLEVTDWSSGEPRALVVPLDPARPARVQVEAMFARARRLKKGASFAEARLADTRAQIEGLETVRSELTALGSGAEGEAKGADLAAVDALGARAKAIAPRDLKIVAADAESGRGSAAGSAARGAADGSSPSLPYRAFVREDGARILVGKGAEKNDRLTFQLARPHDLWLHAKGWTGAHVVVPLSRAAGVTGDLLADAALLAAHFSDARDEAVVDVEYTSRKYLKKPRGSVPGRVVIEREKVIALRIDPARRKALLEREET